MSAFKARSARKSSGAPAGPSIAGTVWLILLLIGLPAIMAALYYLYDLSEMPGRGLRYLIFPPLILALVMMTGARFVQHVYGLRSMRSGLRYLMARMFGLDLPVLMVNEGKIHVEVMGEEDLLYTIGGPGYLVVTPGSAALLEGLDGGLRVVGPGRRYVTELESLKETISLAEMSGAIEKTSAITRDGIEITARSIAYRYRLYSGEPAVLMEGSPSNLASFSDEGMIRLVYSRAMGPNGPGDWHGAVKGTVEGLIQDFIRQNVVDYLTAPQPGVEDPRGDIQKQFVSPSGRKRFHEKGAELVWVDIGHFELPESVAQQRVDLWQTPWASNAELMRAMGQAERIKYQEMGRNEGRAEMIRSMVEMLSETSQDGEVDKNRRTVFLATVSQMLAASRKEQASLPESTQKSDRKDETK